MANEVVEQKATAVAKKEGTLKDLIKSDSFTDAVQGFFTVEANRKRFVQSAVNALTKTPKLSSCDKMSFFGSLMQLASFGLEPNGRDAHLIPYGQTCTLIIDYKGLVTLAMRSERVSKCEAFEVYKNDHFRLVNGEVEHIVDDPWGDRGDLVGFYAVCTFKDGAKKYEVMSKADVDAIRKRSKSGQSGPWVTDYNQMGRKTVFKRLTKWLPVTPELQDAITADDEDYQAPNNNFNRSSRVTANDLLRGSKPKEADVETINAEATVVPADGQADVNDCI